jgi:CMP/dCMP kinase
MTVTFGGRAGAGKSTAARAIAQRLGYQFYSAGDVRREYALKNGMTLEELNQRAETDPASDFLVDDYMRGMARTRDDISIDAWLGFHFFPQSIKLYFDADPRMRAERIFDRRKKEELSFDVDEAFQKMTEKENCSAARYLRLYGVDIYDKKNYDHVIDTTYNSEEDTINQIMSLDCILKLRK